MFDKANQAGADVLIGVEPSSQESHVGQRVRQLRMDRGYSIRGLAEASGLSVNTLSLIENGKISPSVSTCLLYTSPSPRDRTRSRMPSSA